MNVPFLRPSRFTEFLVNVNALEDHGFKGWSFEPGMLFNAPNQWWDGKRKRDKPHEGLDLCLYKTWRDEVRQLGENTKIPVLYEGVVAKLMDDFIGRTVVVEHDFEGPACTLLTLYGHTKPYPDLRVGDCVMEGDVLATLAAPKTSSSTMIPHLHLSLARISEAFPYDRLDWASLYANEALTLMDPLTVLDERL